MMTRTHIECLFAVAGCVTFAMLVGVFGTLMFLTYQTRQRVAR